MRKERIKSVTRRKRMREPSGAVSFLDKAQIDDLEEGASEDTTSDFPNVDDHQGEDITLTSSTKDSDYQKEFKILGQTEFAPLERIKVTASWVSSATIFPADINAENLANLSSVRGIPDPIAKLVEKRIKSWFPVQSSVLPCLLHDIACVPPIRPRDLAISAPTGSGKTLCYVLPILAQIGSFPSGQLRALVVAPVQTLVQQIEQEFSNFNACGAFICALSGATEFSKEQKHLAPSGKSIADVIISTPARLMDHLTDPSSGITLTALRFLVVDEADRMGTMVRQEWLEAVERRSGGMTRCVSLADLSASRWAPRKIILSATLSRDVEELHMWNLHEPRLFRANVSGSKKESVSGRVMDHDTGKLSLPSSIHHKVLAVERQFHPLVLYLQIVERNWQKVLVFTNERESSQRLAVLMSYLGSSDFRVEHLTGDLFGKRRAKILKRFKNGTTRVLICSDVLSRGVDVEDIDCVVNYELPKDDRLFVHRAGRTGRAGKAGEVLSLGDGEEKKIFVKNVLRKSGLWLNAEEEVVERSALESHLSRYKEALKFLRKTIETRSSVAAAEKSGKVSGFAFRKKSRYIQLKERLKVNSYIPLKKEKRDFIV